MMWLNFKRQKTNHTKQAQDDFHATASSSVLAEDDLAQLARLKKSSTQIQLMKIFKENQQFAFIAFTLLLAAFVYFYSRKNLEDDVT